MFASYLLDLLKLHVFKPIEFRELVNVKKPFDLGI